MNKAAFDADPNCTGRVMRGLLHRDQTTVVYHDHLYTLHQLDELLLRWETIRMAATIPPSAHTSRNYAMFRALEGYACELYKAGCYPAQRPAPLHPRRAAPHHDKRDKARLAGQSAAPICGTAPQ